jgi:hypothetical protein
MNSRKRPLPICDVCCRRIEVMSKRSLRWTMVHVCANCQAAAWRVVYDRDRKIGKLPANLLAG